MSRKMLLQFIFLPPNFPTSVVFVSAWLLQAISCVLIVQVDTIQLYTRDKNRTSP